jgi:hypothetical protein
MKSTSCAELAELYERGDRAIKEARKLREDYRFIVSRLSAPPARNARRTSLRDENGNDAIEGAGHPPSRGRDREIKLAVFARETLARWLAEVDPVHSA